MTLYLDDLRQRIDAIDMHMCDLLRERMDIVHTVGERKNAAGIAGSFIRSGREADMIRRLSANLDGVFCAASVARIWRAVIASSLKAEHDFIIHAPARPSEAFWLAREYFAGIIPVKEHGDAEQVIAHADTDASSVGILPVSDTLPAWWLRPEEERNDLYVFACVPFVDDGLQGLPDMFAFANITPEETGEDATLVALDARGASAEPSVLRAHIDGLRAVPIHRVHAVCDGGALVSLPGYVSQENIPLPTDSAFREARIIGRYALPVTSA